MQADDASPLVVHVWDQCLLHVAEGPHPLRMEAMATGKGHQWEAGARSNLRHRAVRACCFALTRQELLQRQHGLDPRNAQRHARRCVERSRCNSESRETPLQGTTASQLQSVLQHSTTSRLSSPHLPYRAEPRRVLWIGTIITIQVHPLRACGSRIGRDIPKEAR